MSKKAYEHLNCIPDFPDPSSLNNISEESLRNFDNSEAYKKYVLPILEHEKQLKKQKRSEWFWLKGLLILNTIFAGISAISALLALLK